MPKFLTSITLPEQASPGTPATGGLALYAKSDGGLYYKNDLGEEVGPLGAGIHVGPTPPENASENDLWLDTSGDPASPGSFSTTFGGTF